MQVYFKAFNQLSVYELFSIYKLRSKVFVVEQNCAYQDVDDKDLDAIHVLMMHNQELAAYCRILKPGSAYAEPAIGRVVVEPGYRKQQLGRQLMQASMAHALQLFKEQDVLLSAQVYLQAFYTSLGFVAEGEVYPEDDIPHIKMRLKVR